MKGYTVFGLLLTISFTLLLLTTQIPYANAEQVSEISRTFGPPGTPIKASANWCDDAIGSGGTTVFLNGQKVGSLQEKFNCEFVFRVPLFPESGTHKIKIEFCGSNSGCQDKTFDYQITKPTVSFSQTIVSPGSTLYANGNGFYKNAPVDIILDDGTTESIRADSSGSFSTDIQIPTFVVTDPNYSIKVDWKARHTNYPTLSKTLTLQTPKYNVPTTIGFEESFTVNGFFLPPQTDVTILIDGKEETIITTDPDGKFSAILSPSLKPESYQITIRDSVGNDFVSTISIQEPSSAVIDWIASPSNGETPLETIFTGTINGGVPPYTYEFDPGDGSTSIKGDSNGVIKINHEYENGGSFTATLLVTDSLGNTQLKTKTINTFSPPPSTPQTTPSSPQPAPSPDPGSPPTPPSTTLRKGTFKMEPIKPMIEVDRHNPASLRFYGDLEKYSRGSVLVLSIIDPDGKKEEQAFRATEDGHYNIQLNINDEWKKGKYSVDLVYKDSTIGSKSFTIASKQSTMPPIPPSESKIKNIPEQSRDSIPITVKNTAKWWGNGQIEDKEFANNIEYMIRNKLIRVSGYDNIEQGMKGVDENIRIPGWIKDVANFWTAQQISDVEFLSAIEYMVEHRIIDLQGTKRADALGIKDESQQTTIDTIRDTFMEDNYLDNDEKTFLEILTLLEQKNISINKHMNSDSFLNSLLSKITSDSIKNGQMLVEIKNACKGFLDDSILQDDEHAMLKELSKFV